jgi:DNA polymerase-3 subunit epsilon
MSDFFLGLLISSIFGFLIGLIKPTLIVNRTRKYTSLLFVGIFIFSFVFFDVTYVESSSANLLAALLGILSIPAYIGFRYVNLKNHVIEENNDVITKENVIIPENNSSIKDSTENVEIPVDNKEPIFNEDNSSNNIDTSLSFDFVAIDFETANSYNGSACSIGLVAVKNNEVAETFSTLIKPIEMRFEEKNIEIHGIIANDVKNAPSFKDVWEQIKHYFNNNSMIIAHNAVFDMSVLKLCLIDHSIPIPEFEYLCSIPISTCACSGEGVGKSLKERTERFGVVLDNHHDASSDAMACAQLVLSCIKEKRRRSFSTYLSTYSSLSPKKFIDLKPQRRFGKSNRFDSVSVNDIQTTVSNIDENNPLFDKNIVFTGDLPAISRRGAMQLAKNCGANIKSSVSRNTDYVVVGEQNKSIVGEDGMSTKERRAYELIDEGYGIKIIDESQFVELVGDNQLSDSINN